MGQRDLKFNQLELAGGGINWGFCHWSEDCPYFGTRPLVLRCVLLFFDGTNKELEIVLEQRSESVLWILGQVFPNSVTAAVMILEEEQS